MYNMDLAYTPPVPGTEQSISFTELNRLLSAAIVSNGFRNKLFTHPEVAVAQGYQGEKFNLTSDEYSWLISIEANDLVSFASQLVEYQNTRTSATEMPIAVKLPEMSYFGSSD